MICNISYDRGGERVREREREKERDRERNEGKSTSISKEVFFKKIVITIAELFSSHT